MKIPCKNHPNSFVERICASSTCKRDPTLCWECIIDESDHARNHRDVMVNIDDFAERLHLEYLNVQEKRLKEKSLAMEGHLKLLETQESYLKRFKQTIENRKGWCSQIIISTQKQFNEVCVKLQEELNRHYDEKEKQYINSLNFITGAIQHRYGLVALPTKEEILGTLNKLGEEKQECNSYVQELKVKLLPPEDLNKNLAFLDTYQEFDCLNELVDNLAQELDNMEQGSEENYYEKEQFYIEIMKAVDNQCTVLVDELKQYIECKDPILCRHSPQILDDESLDSILFIIQAIPQYSAKKATIADKLYESPHLFDSGPSPFATQQIEVSPKLQSFRSSDNQTTIKFQKQIETHQLRGITSLLQIDLRTIATGSRDKTIRINILDNPHQSFNLDGHIDQVTALCLFQEKILISGGGNLDSSLIVWSLSSKKQISRLSGHQSGITSIIELSDKNCVLSGSYDNLAIIWNINSGKSLCALKKHSAMVSSLVLVKRDIVITGSWDRSMAIWQLEFENEQIISAHYLRELRADGAVLCIKKVNERCIISGGTSNKVTIIDWINGEIKQKLSTSQFGICDILVGDVFFGLGASDSTIRLWKNGQEVEVYRDSRIQINNYNTNPKMIQLSKKLIAVVNNNDTQPHFNIFQID